MITFTLQEKSIFFQVLVDFRVSDPDPVIPDDRIRVLFCKVQSDPDPYPAMWIRNSAGATQR